ncbi:MAG: UDP-3-O-(3-hydroxymyristoyl)glucosamine N-acyltransferase [Thermodesulfatator sp.]|nr:MAG: UDP-3-O-(3-hydroxymyristoyl)glucosamine N-acyltransferase [Thermodesulfatator sp.]
MSRYSLNNLAEIVSGRVEGDGEFQVEGISSLESARENEISFAVSTKSAESVASSQAGALILPESWPFEENRPRILVKDVYLAFARIATVFASRPFKAKGVHPNAVIGYGCSVDANVTIMAGVVLGDNVTIGPEVTLHSGVVIGNDVFIAEGSELFPNVVVYDGCKIGRKVRIHAGAIIGSDGFGYAQGPEGHVKIPHMGTVEIEDYVEIGANTTIDRAVFGKTIIGQGTKIDNLVMIAHNVHVGSHSIIVSQVGISGSTNIGSGVMIGGQVGIVGHIDIGDKARIGAKSGVAQSIAAGQTVSGIPAIPHRKWLRLVHALMKVPEMLKDIREIKKRLEKLNHGKG